MAYFNWYELPPDTCERCGDRQADLYCHGEIVFDDGDTVPVCDHCAHEWFYSRYVDERGYAIPEKAAAFQRRGVESYRERWLRESRERRAAAQDD